MKIGMLTGIWFVAESAPLRASLRRAAALGFCYVDLHGPFHAGPAHLTMDERLAVKAEMESLGLTPRCYVLHPLHNIASASDAELEQDYAYLQEGIDLAVSWEMNQLNQRRAMGLWARPRKLLDESCPFPATGVRLCRSSWSLHSSGDGALRVVPGQRHELHGKNDGRCRSPQLHDAGGLRTHGVGTRRP